MTPKQTPFTVPAGGSRSRQMYTSLGQATVKVSGADTQGAFVIFEVTVVPSGGPPFTCIMCRVSGSTYPRAKWSSTLGRYIPGELRRVCLRSQDASAYLPNVGQKDAKILALAVPSGRMEAFIAQSEALVAQGTPEPDSVNAFFEKYDLELVAPPLAGWPRPR